MDFFLFGPSSRPLFGGFHEGASGGVAVGAAVLLCPPWGQEAVRTHRMYRVLAERLARAGAHVLRFDYHGTGDSPGDDADFDLRGAIGDVAAAHAQLIRLARPKRVVWVSLRLGASVAWQALADGVVERPPEHVIAWEPVVDGGAYLDTLRCKHVEALESTYTRQDPQWRRDLANDPLRFRDEAMGFALSPRLRADLLAIRSDSIGVPPSPRLSVLTPSGEPLSEALRRRLNSAVARFETTPLDHDFDWTSEEALNTALVPGPAVQILFDLCTTAP